jgi:hypothetical protein
MFSSRTHPWRSPSSLMMITDNDGKPSRLVDWEAAAWMPEYWETTRSFKLYKTGV